MMLLIVDIACVSGKRDEVVDHIHALLEGGGEGLLQYTVGTSNDDPNAITVVEEWQDAQTHAAFMQTATFETFREAVSRLYAAPPSGRLLNIHVPTAHETPPAVISLL